MPLYLFYQHFIDINANTYWYLKQMNSFLSKLWNFQNCDVQFTSYIYIYIFFKLKNKWASTEESCFNYPMVFRQHVSKICTVQYTRRRSTPSTVILSHSYKNTRNLELGQSWRWRFLYHTIIIAILFVPPARTYVCYRNCGQ